MLNKYYKCYADVAETVMAVNESLKRDGGNEINH